MLGWKKEIERKKEDREKKERGVLAGKMCLGHKWWWLIEVYINNDLEEKLEILREWMESKEVGVRILIGEILMQG